MKRRKPLSYVFREFEVSAAVTRISAIDFKLLADVTECLPPLDCPCAIPAKSAVPDCEKDNQQMCYSLLEYVLLERELQLLQRR